MTYYLANFQISCISITRFLLLAFIATFLWGCGTAQVKPGGEYVTNMGLQSLSKSQIALYHDALSNLQSNDAKSAERKLKKLVSSNTGVPELWLNLALSQYQQSHFKPAEKSLNSLFKQSNSVAQAYNLAGLIAVENGAFEKAVNYYKDAIKVNPEYANALYNMALVQDVYLQDVDAALMYYEKYLVIEVEDQTTKNWVAHLKSSVSQ